VLVDTMRAEGHQLRVTAQAEAIKVIARAHQTLI